MQNIFTLTKNTLPRGAYLLVILLFTVTGTAETYTGDVWRDATLYRDDWGTPHIFAQNPFSLGFSFGYAQAEDHAEVMLLAYRMVNGRLSEVFGESYVESDIFSLKMGHIRVAEESYPHLDAFTQAICEGFSTGVNAWLVEHHNTLPAWADGMKPTDILGLWHAFLMSMAPMDLPDLYRRSPAMESANAWAVSAERSAEGKAALVINPHQRHDGFFQWYEAHLVLGEINIYGATIKGLPVIVQGCNDRLGWALSPNQADFADIFREEFEPQQAARNPKSIQSPQEATNMEHAMLLHYMSQSQPYRVRVGGGLETRYVPAFIGARGPMFEHSQLGLHSWYIGGYRDFGGLRQLFEMGAARNLDQFCDALSMHQIPCFHILYADQSGNIFYLFNTKSGTRVTRSVTHEQSEDGSVDYRWDQPQSYKLAAMSWKNVIPINALPYLLNPPSGFIQACANPPWTATAPPVLNPQAWPPWLAQESDSYRAKRVRQLLQQGQRSYRDHQSMLFDCATPTAFALLPALFEVVTLRSDLTQAMLPDFWTGLELLKNWNYICETSSTGMSLFHQWWYHCTSRAAKVFPSTAWFIEETLNGSAAAQEILLFSLEDAVRAMRNQYGTLEQAWGDIHRIRRGQREEPIAGAIAGDAIFTASDHENLRGKWIANYGYGFAMVVQFGDVPEAVSLLPFGSSDVPMSLHYDDQLDLMLSRRFKHAHILQEDSIRNAAFGTGKNILLLPRGVTGALTLSGAAVMHGRVQTDITTPHPVPIEYAPFSFYMEIDRKPLDVPVNLLGSIHIAPDLCDSSNFEKLKVYSYESGLDWQPVPNQRLDRTQQNIYFQENAIAEWYVVLGPAEAAQGAEASLPTPQSQNYPAESLGLDGLLNMHNNVHVGTERKAIFEFKRHDPETENQETPTERLTPRTPSKGIFKFETKTDSSDEPAKSTTNALSGIPGFHFGPQAKSEQQGTSPSDEAFAPPDTIHVTTEKADKIPTPTDTSPLSETSPTIRESETRPPAHETEAAPTAEASADETIQTPKKEKDSAQQKPKKTQSRSEPLPPLPDVIPKDQNFVFGPSQKTEEKAEPEDGKVRTFKMELLDK
ncbi:MAG: hypothetical protein GX117_11025 [Candidatus Hydrogenedentes bacterium]|nr:hypothetical protein [Candidatus Hydrogenedentota bacterium]